MEWTTPDTAVAETEDPRLRRSLAVDQVTFDRLKQLCAEGERSKIAQVRMLINREWERLVQEGRIHQ